MRLWAASSSRLMSSQHSCESVSPWKPWPWPVIGITTVYVARREGAVMNGQRIGGALSASIDGSGAEMEL